MHKELREWCRRFPAKWWPVSLLLGLFCAASAHAQGNYEIQVYGAATVEPKSTMVELHSNFTAVGQMLPANAPFPTVDGVYPTNHQEHETLEITQGINDWSEVGFYVFTSLQDGHGWQWVGDHIRPRVRVPDSWHWPIGVSLSTEVGYQRAIYSPDTWTWEIRPIIDKSLGRWYFAVNPALERTWHGPDVAQGVGFSPAVKVGYDFTKLVSGGIEYYADYGRLGNFYSLHNQQQQIFVVTDLNVSPKWEINIGAGIGPTAATDRWIIKAILGRHFSWVKQPQIE
ncbi:hypothetical protein ACPOL_3665 [Acidisarcina polymorpha]|uniref:Uncharacterized protein n=1 Tax=Acidisarcina polymorpha TaxID=2211140 RepID=A0A2Z5G346_9BACT|nr:hypothetical protein [Acidisarcina polymorpha]AXC12946.1 hypothetical protein ACPOL_3665 [Acidisarcina polymorpha]